MVLEGKVFRFFTENWKVLDLEMIATYFAKILTTAVDVCTPTLL